MTRLHDARPAAAHSVGHVWIGDFVRAHQALDLDLDAACAVLRMLGFDAELPVPAAAALLEPAPRPHRGDPLPPPQPPAARASPPAPTETSASTRVYSECTPLADEGPAHGAPDWLGSQAALDLTPRPPRTPPPLFSRLRRRSILVALVARQVADGAPDVHAIVRLLARGEPLRKLPRKHRRTLAFGVEVLLDGADSLQPFRADGVELVNALRDLLPDRRLLVTHVRGGPAGAQVHGPLPRSTVLAVSDFGVGFRHVGERPAPVAHWVRHARQLAAADRSLRALVPLPPRRCAAALQRRVPLVQWSESTTLGDVRRALQPGNIAWAADSAAARQARQQAALDLATVLAPAVRIDPALLRSVRRELLPALGPEAEADLWFGPLVATRSAVGVTLQPGASSMLGERLLRDEPVPLDRVLEVLERLAPGASDSVDLEESLQRAALAGTLDEEAIELALRPVYAALAHADTAQAVATWWPQAWQRMPPVVRDSASARRVSLAAAVHLHTKAWLPSTLPGPAAHEDIRWLLPESAKESEAWSVELREYEDAEVVARVTRDASPSHAVYRLHVPAGSLAWIGVTGRATRPASHDEGEPSVRWLQLEPGLEFDYPAPEGDQEPGDGLVLQTLDGKRVRIAVPRAGLGMLGALVHAGPDWFGVAITDDLALMCPARHAPQRPGSLTYDFMHCASDERTGPARFLGAVPVPDEQGGPPAECWVVRFEPGTLRPIDSEPVRDAGKPPNRVWLRWDGSHVSFTEAGTYPDSRKDPGVLYPTIEVDETLPEPWAFPGEAAKASNLRGASVRGASVSRRFAVRIVRDDAIALRRGSWVCAIAAGQASARPATQLREELVRRLADWRVSDLDEASSTAPDRPIGMLRPDVLLIIGTEVPSAHVAQLAASGVPVLWAPMSRSPNAAQENWPPALRDLVAKRQWFPFGADEQGIRALAEAIVEWGNTAFPGADSARDGPAGVPAPAQLEQNTGVWTSLTRRARKSLIAKLEESVRPGLHLVPLEGEFRLMPVGPTRLDPSKPLLLLLHGQATTAAGSFSPLWAPEARVQLARLRERYGFALAFEYLSITRSLVDTASELVGLLPYAARLHVLGHSTGGAVGELLCTGQGSNGTFDAMERTSSLRRLSSALREQNLKVEHLLRVGSPMRGAAAFSKGLARISSVAGVLGTALPFLPVSWLTEQIQQIYKDPESSPGLADMQPGSTLVELLNDPTAVADASSRLTIIAGVQAGGGIRARLVRLSTAIAMSGSRNDLFVELQENFGGYARPGGFDMAVYEGPEVSHFNFFKNVDSRTAIVDALVASTSPSLKHVASYREALAQLGLAEEPLKAPIAA